MDEQTEIVNSPRQAVGSTPAYPIDVGRLTHCAGFGASALGGLHLQCDLETTTSSLEGDRRVIFCDEESNGKNR
jgi:hypothetical protein